MAETLIIRPQPAQERFLAARADIAIYGGAAGGGKSWSLLIEPLRHIHRPDFGTVVFRRTRPEITAQGGLWDASTKIYPLLGAVPNLTDLSWRFPSGSKVRFSHLQHEHDVYAWKSSEIPLIEFDQLEDFTEQQFFYMLSRSRTTCGIRPYIRAGCNPDATSWLAGFIAWWIDQKSGYPLTSRAGSQRWFVRIEDRIVWADRPDGFKGEASTIPPKSVAFFPAKLADNEALLKADPGYRANLMAMHKVDRERLLGGNWKITDTTGSLVERGWIRLVEAVPIQATRVRYWDKAATSGGGDYSAGVLVCRDSWGVFFVEDVVRGQWSAGQRNRVIKETAAKDRARYGLVDTWIEEEGGSGGKESAEISVIDLAGYIVHTERVSQSGDKTSRFKPFACQAEVGNVRVLQAAWTPDYLDEITAFPKGKHDDQCDATSGAVNKLSMMPLLDPAGSIHVPDNSSILDQLPDGVFG